MSGMETFMWRSTLKWAQLIAIAQRVVDRWNGVTEFVVKIDQRERIWTVRHNSTIQPFLVISEESMRGSAPRIGNPLPMLMLLGMVHLQPDCVEISFANGQKIDLLKLELADLTGLLPQATHPAHRKLAELSMQSQGA